MNIFIRPEEVAQAKEMRDKLDAIKTYNKINSKNNYIGVLGEIVLHRYLKENDIEHVWIEFLKDNKGWNEPDFLIQGKTIDLKTTRGVDMWFQDPKFDLYVHASINNRDTVMKVDGIATAHRLNEYIKDNTAKKVIRGNRYDYVVSPLKMIAPVFILGVN